MLIIPASCTTPARGREKDELQPDPTPPFEVINCPLIQAPSSEQRKETRFAASRGSPSLARGVCCSICTFNASLIQPVSVGPGLMTFAVTPRNANSFAAASVMRSSAALLAPYGRVPRGASDVMAMILGVPNGDVQRSANSR